MSVKRPRFTQIVTVTAAGLAMALFMASPAMADTSQSSASALQLTLVGGGLASSGQTTASNDGTTETLTGTQNPLLTVLGTQPVISAGVLGQTSRAFTDGSSAACAGVVGAGGSIVVGGNGNCVATPGGSAVSLALGTIVGTGAIALTADAIYSSCNATSAPTATGTTSLVNAKITATLLGITTTLLNLSANPAPNSGLTIPLVLDVTENAQTTPTPGEITVTALNISAISGALASLQIGHVVCGPNAQAEPVPSIPLKGTPIALGLGGLIAAGGVLAYRRYRSLTA